MNEWMNRPTCIYISLQLDSVLRGASSRRDDSSLCTNVSMDTVKVRSSTRNLFHDAGPNTTVSPTDRSPCTCSTSECPAVCRPQLPPAECRRRTKQGYTRQPGIGQRQTLKASVGDHRQLEGDSLPYWKPVELTQRCSNVVKLSCSSHDTRCCVLDSLTDGRG